jgi:hypothetical protein
MDTKLVTYQNKPQEKQQQTKNKAMTIDMEHTQPKGVVYTSTSNQNGINNSHFHRELVISADQILRRDFIVTKSI